MGHSLRAEEIVVNETKFLRLWGLNVEADYEHVRGITAGRGEQEEENATAPYSLYSQESSSEETAPEEGQEQWDGNEMREWVRQITEGGVFPTQAAAHAKALRQEETGHVLKMVRKGDFPGGPVVHPAATEPMRHCEGLHATTEYPMHYN